MSASMDQTQRQLFGRFPRSVGSPEQHIVHSESEFDVFTETVQGRRNAYSSISWFPVGGGVVCDKVSFDFDSAAKEEAFHEDVTDDIKIKLMRSDPDLAEEVLGEVCEDVQKLAQASLEESIPVMGIFSGFGVHVHQLYQPESNPAEHMGSTARYWREELGLVTLDHKPIGDEQRIMRVPNMKRVHLEDIFDPEAGRYECDLWTVPLTGRELAEATPQSLLSLSGAPRPNVTVESDERRAMPFYEDYVREDRSVTSRPDRPSVEGKIDSEGIDWYVKELLQMPCVYENLLLDPEPPHKIRLNAAVLLFNVGLDVGEVLDLFEAIGWSDWDRQVTARQLDQIHKRGYSDMSCQKLRKDGYCTRSDNPPDCPTFGWSGGAPEWKE